MSTKIRKTPKPYAKLPTFNKVNVSLGGRDPLYGAVTKQSKTISAQCFQRGLWRYQYYNSPRCLRQILPCMKIPLSHRYECSSEFNGSRAIAQAFNLLCTINKAGPR